MHNFFISIYPYLFGAMEVLIEYYFFYRFLGRKRSFACLLLFLFTGITVMALLIALCPAGGILEFIVYVIFFMISGIAIGRIPIIAALLYAVIITEIMNLCYGIFHSISCILIPLVFEVSPNITGLLVMASCSTLSLMLAVFCYTRIEKYLRNAESGSRQYLLMILAPMLLILFVSEYISQKIYGNTITINTDGKVFLRSSPYAILLIQILGIASLFCVLHAYKKMAESFQLSRQVSLLTQEAHALNQYVEEANTRFEKTKSFRHDIKNHVTVLKGLIQNSQIESALQYVENMETLTSDLSFPVSTNNPVLDILLANKLGLAISKQINVNCSLAVPYPSKIEDIDFCIVLSNALDNAISACSQMKEDTPKFIHISSKIHGSFLMIEVSNSYTGKKAVKQGTGIANIKAVTEKYQGSMNITTDGKIFTLNVLFIIPQHSDDISLQTDKE